MNNQVRSAKAVVDIDEVHFLNHKEFGGEPKITDNLLKNKAADGTTALNPGWFSVATLKGSVEVTQDPLSLTKINIDQSNMPIGISTEPGDFNVSFFMPSLVYANLKKWLANSADDLTPKVTIEDENGVKKEGYGYDFNAELSQLSMAIKSKTGEWFVFPNIQGSVAMQQQEKTWGMQFNGQVLGATQADNYDVYILNETPSEDASGDQG